MSHREVTHYRVMSNICGGADMLQSHSHGLAARARQPTPWPACEGVAAVALGNRAVALGNRAVDRAVDRAVTII